MAERPANRPIKLAVKIRNFIVFFKFYKFPGVLQIISLVFQSNFDGITQFNLIPGKKMDLEKDILLKDLLGTSEISNRAINVCKKVKIYSLRDLNKFIFKYKNFKNVRGAGKKTNRELLRLNKHYSNDYILATRINYQKDRQSEALGFNGQAKEAFHKMLGIRAQKALMNYFDNELPSKEIINEEFIIRDFLPEKLPNVGEKTAIEIRKFIGKLIFLCYKFY